MHTWNHAGKLALNQNLNVKYEKASNKITELLKIS